MQPVTRRPGEKVRLLVGSTLAVACLGLMLAIDWEHTSQWWLVAWGGLVLSTAVVLMWDEWHR